MAPINQVENGSCAAFVSAANAISMTATAPARPPCLEAVTRP